MPPRGADAAAEPVTSATILTLALEATISPKMTRCTCFLALASSPARSTGTAIGIREAEGETSTTCCAWALFLTALSKTTLPAGLLTAGASESWGTHTFAIMVMTDTSMQAAWAILDTSWPPASSPTASHDEPKEGTAQGAGL